MSDIRCCCRSFVPGEIFVVRNDMGDGWLWVTSKSTGLSGIVNRELVKDLVRFFECCVSVSILQHKNAIIQ